MLQTLFAVLYAQQCTLGPHSARQPHDLLRRLAPGGHTVDDSHS